MYFINHQVEEYKVQPSKTQLAVLKEILTKAYTKVLSIYPSCSMKCQKQTQIKNSIAVACDSYLQ